MSAKLLCLVLFLGCLFPSVSVNIESQSQDVRFIGEYIIPASTSFNNTRVGGLSSIDYSDGNYYLICDDKKNTRFYTMSLRLDEKGIRDLKITAITNINNASNNEVALDKVDPEGMRYNRNSDTFFWVDEGGAKKNISCKLQEMSREGKIIRGFDLPESFRTFSDRKKWGPRNNKSLESISISNDGRTIFVAMESALKQDGKKPKIKSGTYPIRMATIDSRSGKTKKQFAYHLDPVARPKKNEDGVELNGLAEILVFDENSILTVERSFSSGYSDGGNEVKIYRGYFEEATDISNIETLKDADYQPLRKELFFDFETIRNKLTNGVVDNIEGICFGPTLENGNRTLVVVADDNFGKYGDQMNQFIALEIVQ